MKTRWTYLGDSTIEIVVDGDSIEVNVLPAEHIFTPEPILTPDVKMPEPVNIEPPPVSSTPADSQTVNTVPPEITAEPILLAAPPKHRGLSAFIRGAWTLIFGVIGEAAVYVFDNLGILNLPPGTGVALGAVLYAVKKYAKPDGLI